MSGEENSNINQSFTSLNKKIKTGFFNGLGCINTEVKYEVENGYAIIEDDICIGTAEELEESNKSSVKDLRIREALEMDAVGHDDDFNRDPRFRWPNGVIPYEIDSRLPNQQRITDAMTHWTEKTGITFVRREKESDYIYFLDVGRCWSQGVGRTGGRQHVSLTSMCTRGETLHEIGHVVGLYHEHNRNDRDHFIIIDYNNILPNQENNFAQSINSGRDIGNYDYCSIMHYGKYAFARDRTRPTITARRPVVGCEMGQRNQLSAKDIAKVMEMYPNLPPLTR